MDTRPLDQLGDEIAELSAHLDAATARLLDLIREFDIRQGWNTGFHSCAAWLSWRVGLEMGAARERVRVARALETLPRLADALARGQLSYAKVRALTRVATPKEEEKLLAIGRAGTAEHVERIVRGWRRMDRKEEVREAALQHAGRALHVYQNEDGMVTVRGRLTPEAGALLVRALDAAREALYQKAQQADDREPQPDPPTMAQQQADALVLLAETALHHEIDPGAPGERYQVVVHVDASVLADAEALGQSVFEEGARVSAETSQRFACDASRVVMEHDADGRFVDIAAAGHKSTHDSASGYGGPRAAPPRCQTSCCCAAATIALCTKRDIRSIESPTASFDFGARMVESFPTSCHLLRCQTTRPRRRERGTLPTACGWTRGRPRRDGAASDWTSVGR